MPPTATSFTAPADSVRLDTIDTVRRVATPEGIELALRLAGPAPRALAWVIDFALRAAIVVALLIALTPFEKVGTAIVLITAFLLEWIMPAWCEVYWNGATPGKKALGLMVMHDDGRPVRWPAALTRNLLRAADFLPMLYGFGLIATLANRDFKRIGDLAAGTIVVYREPVARVAKIPVAAPIAPPTALAVSEQRTIIDLAERLATLSPERAEELASLAPALSGTRAVGGAARLVGIANHLVGESIPRVPHAARPGQ